MRCTDLLLTWFYILSLFVFGCSRGYSFIPCNVRLSVSLNFLIGVPAPVLAVSVVRGSSLALPMPPLVLARRPTGTTVSVISLFRYILLLLVLTLLLG